MQAGGGLYVYSGGVANLDGCNVYSNEAQVSARLTPLPGPYLQRPAEMALFLAFAQGVAARILNLCRPYLQRAAVRCLAFHAEWRQPLCYRHHDGD